jgi:hypothetical protein
MCFFADRFRERLRLNPQLLNATYGALNLRRPISNSPDQTVRNLRPMVKKINPITPRTTTMSQWITLPIALLATIATARTTAIEIAENAIDPSQPRAGSFWSDFEIFRDFELEFASDPLRSNRDSLTSKVPR